MKLHLLAGLLLVLILLGVQGRSSRYGSYSYEEIKAGDTDLVRNINHQSLVGEISSQMEAMYLHSFDLPFDTFYTGYIFGRNERALICLPVRLASHACPTMSVAIIFEYAPGSPTTALTGQALDAIYQNCPKLRKKKRNAEDKYMVQIAGHELEVNRSTKKINILGADFLIKTKSQVQYWNQHRARPNIVLVFPGDEDYVVDPPAGKKITKSQDDDGL